MDVLISVEARLHRAPDGSIWTEGGFPYSFWGRYTGVFEGVRVLARVAETEKPAKDWQRVDGPGVQVAAVPHYLGPMQYLRRAWAVRRAVAAAYQPGLAVIMRVPSLIGVCLEAGLKRDNYPFGLVVVGDPHDVFAPGGVDHAMRPFFRWWFTRHLKEQCLRAAGVAYVTEFTLQDRYPCRPDALRISDSDMAIESIEVPPAQLATYYSSLELPDEGFRGARPIELKKLRRLITVGSLAQLYKGTDVLLQALARCIQRGSDVSLVVAGEGKFRPQLEKMAVELGISDRVRFLGQVPQGKPLWEQLDAADLFVLPSRTEGLPRAMIEAMARGLPCIGSSVGGIPELLDPEQMVPPGDVEALAEKIQAVLGDPELLSRLSWSNSQRVLKYQGAELQKRRDFFCRYVRTVTEKWLESRQVQPEPARV